jgi:thioesterase domain-containing protein
MKPTFKVEAQGFRDLDNALGELPKATAKNTMRRAAIEALKPMAQEYADKLAAVGAVLSGALRDSSTAGTKLSQRQASLNRKAEGKSYVEAFMGPGPLAQATQDEFGNEHQAPRPTLRQTWDAGWRDLLERVRVALAGQIEKAVTRIARKAARDAAKLKG